MYYAYKMQNTDIIQNIIQNLSKNDEIMKNIIDDVGECHIGKNKQDVFSYLVGLIIGQKIRFAIARKKRGILYENTKAYNFTPNDILNLTEEQWKHINLGIDKKEKIIKTAHHFIDNNLSQKNISKQDIFLLQKISGIGIWTVSILMIEYCLDLDLFPNNDKHVNEQLKKYYNIDINDIDTFIKKWSPYKSIAFWFLWKHEIENK